MKTGYPSIDKPWMNFYNEIHSYSELPEGSLYDYIWNANKSDLNKIMISYLGNKISGETFFFKVRCLAHSFQKEGLKKGDVVTLMSLVTPETIYCIYALNCLGVIVNSVYFGMSVSEIEDTINKTSSKMLIILDLAAGKIKNIVDKLEVKKILVLSIADSLPWSKNKLYMIKNRKTDFASNKMILYKNFVKGVDENVIQAKVERDTPAFIVYTSGSTGAPKGVVLTNVNVNSTAFNYISAGFNHEKTDIYMTFIPLFLSIGISLATRALYLPRHSLELSL